MFKNKYKNKQDERDLRKLYFLIYTHGIHSAGMKYWYAHSLIVHTMKSYGVVPPPTPRFTFLFTDHTWRTGIHASQLLDHYIYCWLYIWMHLLALCEQKCNSLLVCDNVHPITLLFQHIQPIYIHIFQVTTFTLLLSIIFISTSPWMQMPWCWWWP